MNRRLRLAIVGCGSVGKKRALALGTSGELVACADVDPARAEDLSRRFGGRAYADWRVLIQIPEVDALIIATPHDVLAPVSLAALSAGKHVLVEKPAARSLKELEPVLAASEVSRAKVRVGFNHRYHRAFRKAKAMVDAGALGELMFVRTRYGHGGRLGYEKEWRADPKRSGGGELLDQGSHAIDLARVFLGDFVGVQGVVQTCFWDMPVEDNGFMILRTSLDRTAFIHVSCTEWKNLFSMEIYGKKGKLHVEGLGGSYGTERLTFYRMLPEMGPPEVSVWEYPGDDDSWAYELSEFYKDIEQDRRPSPGLQDARAVLSVIERLYREAGYDHCS